MRVELELECSDMEPGDSRRIVCPVCRGGGSGERSLSVTRNEEGALLFLCYRASCEDARGRPFRGIIGGSPTRLASIAKDRPCTYKVRKDPADRLMSLWDVELLEWPSWTVYWQEADTFGCRWDQETQRLALPVYGPTGRIRGWVLRALAPRADGGPKTLAVPTAAEPQLAWNRLQGTTVVVVEDIPSSIRLREFGVRSVALNGTHITDEACDELIAEAEDVVFALDRDAFKKAQSWEQKLRIHFNRTATLLLPKDFKNMNNNEVTECLASGPSWVAFSDPGKPTTA